MASQIAEIRARLNALQEALEQEIEDRRARFRYHLERGRVVFEEDMRRAHRAARENLGAFLARTRPMVVLTAPLIYGLIVPFALLDLCVSLYQAVNFRIYGIPRVPRADFIRIDRQHLQYLNALQKLNCVYCGYVNGLVAWVREIASRTEAYWCPIKHAARVSGAHDRYGTFADYGDAEGFGGQVEAQRARLRDSRAGASPERDSRHPRR